MKYLLFLFSAFNLHSMDHLKVPGISLPRTAAQEVELKTNLHGKLFSKAVKYRRMAGCCGFDEHEFDIEISSDNLTCFALKEIIVNKIIDLKVKFNGTNEIKIFLNDTESCSHNTDFSNKPFNFVDYRISALSN